MSAKTRSRPLAALILSIFWVVPLSVHAADPVEGRKLASQCKTCHGIDGIAKIPIAPNLAGESQMYIEKQLKAFRSGARTHEMMSVVAKNLTNADISNLAAWYQSIAITATIPE